MEDLLLIGFGGHARSVVDTIEKKGIYNIVGFSEIKRNVDNKYRGYEIICTDDQLEELYQSGIKKAFVTVGYMGNSSVRNHLYEKLLKIGFEIPVIIDDTAVVASDVMIGQGTYIGKNAIVNSNAVIGDMCIINTGAIVEHDCIIGDFTHVAVGAVICGMCSIGRQVFIGANATVVQQRMIEDNIFVGACCVVRSDMKKDCNQKEK